MGHHINALIGSKQALANLSARFGLPLPTELTSTLQILPLDEERLDALGMSAEDSLRGFTYLTPKIAAEIASTLDGEPALYIETDYFGGMGGQCAALFKNGALEWSDASSDLGGGLEQSWFKRLLKQKPTTINKAPISQGLAMLGVTPTEDHDEFDAVGLGRFRSLDALGIGDDD